MAVGVHEATSSTPEGAANVGGAGLGFMDEQRLREKEAREDAEMAADRKLAAAKLAAGPGLLDPVSKKVHGSIMDVPNAIMSSLARHHSRSCASPRAVNALDSTEMPAQPFTG